ncbi:Glu/Leu/Phe/Val family dehydrogenase [Pseudobacteriovorax antillogorgiicola]|uniref:Leucine dehydrogenase n=1 Tax=Pseudobacteriovorax antillogorgiicola TaxID=1513793 RepID=A0A1Y6CWJ6_9BACT|nr:Glu/Leu/Phe/Val dehydrogenase [Pseudobacteriovorax antillogorgiicola]TCS42251.1 leucine dehydrogenase [Pseudobacteriovorax antillogorgiicola]SMF82601.1 leucine dehydrogenase [Pseudobacteriovorax antillogorgiicola]
MAIFETLAGTGHEQVVFCNDEATGLKAIIAIHDTTLGPALGGCRMWDYGSEEEALEDVLRLSRGMTYKAAVSGLSLGGGKSVIIGDPKKLKNEAFFRTFGRFVDSLSGRYITAEDVNIRVKDMESVALETPYVTGINSRVGGSGDPSPVTAWGVFNGIKASVKHKLGKDSVNGLTVAVQGCGAVGTFLTEFLTQEGAKVFAADLNQDKVKNVVESFGAEAVDLNKIHSLPVDVYAPCALGGILNDNTIPELQTTIVSGGANNQLLDEAKHAAMLKEKGILYAPDYVINAGGLINVYQELQGYDADAARTKAAGIFDTLINIYKESDEQGITTIQASNKIAEDRINSVRNMKDLRNNFEGQLWINQ